VRWAGVTRFSGRTALALVFVVTLAFVTPRIRGADEIQYFSYLHSVFFDHDLEFGNEYQFFYDRDPQGLQGFGETFLGERELRTGRHINFGPLGSALLWSPFYGLAHLALLAARALGFAVTPDGLSRPYEAAACYASALYGFLGLLLIYAALRRTGGLTEQAAAGSVITVWLATPAVYYMTIAPGFSHACSLFAVSLFLWLWLRTREDDEAASWRFALLGATGGLAGLVREQDIFFLVVPGLDVLLRGLQRRRYLTILWRNAVMAAAALLVFSPQMLAYRAINGTFEPSPHVGQKMRFWSPHFLEVLADPAHGLFFWSPVIALAVLVLLWLWLRERKAVPGLLLVGLLAQVWINGSVESWSQAGAFGSRRFVGATFVFAWGLGALFAALLGRGRRKTTLALCAIFVWWNLSLMVQFGLRLMDRQKLEWPRVGVNQLTEVPPRLARALTLFFSDRERLVKERL
jgi:hypothetical protein